MSRPARAAPGEDDMIQELFHIGRFAISPFGVMLVCAFLGGYLQLRWGLRRLEIGAEDDASSLVFAAGVGGIVGAKIYYALLVHDWHVLFDRSGLVWYGGFVLGAAAVLWTARRRRLPGWPLLDAASPALALGYAIGRIGCFLVGDDYGVPTALPWGVAFRVGLPPTTAGELRQTFHVDIAPSIPDEAMLRVHPTQLYETGICLVIWAIGIWLLRRRPARGVVGLVIIGLLAIERFGIEFIRVKDDRFIGSFTLAQAISLLVLVVIAALLWRRRAEPSRVAAAAASTR
jgi:phosphatidylglycerol:prolipoprotein diacylglycerol transferase